MRRSGLAQVTDVPGAASVSLASLLEGPPRPGWVSGVGPAALFVIMAEDRGVFTVCMHDAVRLPLAIVVAAPVARSPWVGRLSAGDGVTVGGDLVRLPGLTVRVVRWWVPARPRAGNREGLDLSTSRLLDLLRERAVDLPAAIGTSLRRLGHALATGDHDRIRRAVDAMLGLGPGLTPTGDDVIAGLLLAVHHLGEPRDPAMAALRAYLVTSAPRRTTGLSAALLGQAAQGYAAPQAIAVLSALRTGHGLPGALGALLLVGHTSGGDLAHGIAAGAQFVLSQRGLRGAA